MSPGRGLGLMKAAYLRRHGGPEVIEVGELPDPIPSSTQVLLSIKFSALNHLDLWVRRGMKHLKLQYPHVLGAEASGVVLSTGNDVKKVKKGDAVIIYPGLSCGTCERCLSGWESLCPDYRILGEHVSGTDSEKVCVSEKNVFLKPENISFEEAAGVPLVFTTAWQMLVVRGKVKPGDKVVVHAVGSGVGSAALQIALLHGAQVLATSSDDKKLERAKKIGAHHVVNYRSQDMVEEVKRAFSGGADLVIDHLGGEYWEKNIRLTGWGGTIVTCGATSGFEAKFDLRQLFFRQLSLLGSTMGSKGDFPVILDHFKRGKLKSVISEVFPLSKIKEAHEALENRRVFGKILLQIGGN